MDSLADFHKFCFTKYWYYRETKFEHFSKYTDLVEIINKSSFPFMERGKSIEGRSIYSCTLGSGTSKILLWSQMHGDESTATGALLDILKFFSDPPIEYKKLVEEILTHVTICFVPMLNPDGTERWQRRNVAGIDLNRDARALVSPESRILNEVFDSFRPAYCFNLHDQSGMYTAGLYESPATISLLAPPYNQIGDKEKARDKAIAGVCSLFQLLQFYIPNAVGKWEDDYEPRAFGEFFQSKDAATILIEAGAFPNDPERNMARRLNFTALLYSFAAIAKNEFGTFDPILYENIPENKRRLFDVLLLNTTLEINNQSILCDLALLKKIRRSQESIQEYWSLEQLGDLSDSTSFAGVKTFYQAKASVDIHELLTIKADEFLLTLPFNID